MVAFWGKFYDKSRVSTSFPKNESKFSMDFFEDNNNDNKVYNVTNI